MIPLVAGQIRFGCTRTSDRRKPKHLVDASRYARTREAVALCGTQLYYLDTDVVVRAGDPCSGRQMVSERDFICKWCTRKEVEINSEYIRVPMITAVQIAAGYPSAWAVIARKLDIEVVATIKARL
jgi:hypothetical protein